MKILVVGASGSIGREVVAKALQDGHTVRALVRDGASFGPADRLELFIGDLSKPATLSGVGNNVDGIVFAHGSYGSVTAAEAIDYGGVRNVLAAVGSKVPRLALMTTIAITDGEPRHNWKRRGERLIRAAGAPYTIVRPGWFDYNGPEQQALVFLQGDQRQSGTPRDGAVARRQVARVLVESLSSPGAAYKTLELITDRGREQAQLEPLFVALDPDQPRALDAIHDSANLPLEGEPASVADSLQTLRTTGG